MADLTLRTPGVDFLKVIDFGVLKERMFVGL